LTKGTDATARHAGDIRGGLK